MNTFLDEVVTAIREVHGDELGELCVLVPSRRAVVFLRQALARRYRKTLWAPHIMAIQDFIRQQSGWQFPESLRLVFELYQSYQRAARSVGNGQEVEAFEQFYSWGEMLLRDMDEVDKYLVDAEQLFTNVRDLREIEQTFKLPPESQEVIRRFWGSLQQEEPSDLQAAFLGIWGLMHPVYEGVRQQLQAQGMAYDGMAYRRLAEQLQAGTWKNPYREIIFVGFNALSRSEEVMVEQLLRTGQARIFWDVDEAYYPGTPDSDRLLSGRMAKFIYDYHQRWKDYESHVIMHRMAAAPKSIRISGAPLQVGMARSLGQLLNQQSIAEEELGQHAVVLADEQLLFPVLHALPRSLKPLNITMGFPLRQTSIYALLMSLTRFVRSLKTDQELAFPHAEVLELLNNPYLKALAPALSETLQEEIRTRNLVFIPSAFLMKQPLPPLLAHIFQPPLEARALPAYFDTIFDYLLRQAQEVGEHLEAEYLFAFYTRFNQLRDILQTYQLSLSTVGFSRLFREVIRTARIPFQGEPLVGMQVMGFLETRLLDFEHVYVLGANEGILPNTQQQLSFIPFNLRKGFGLPTHEERDLIISYHFYRLLQRAKQVHLFYNQAQQESGSSGEASRFIHQLRHFFQGHAQLKVEERQVVVPAPYHPPEGICIEQHADIQQRLRRRYEVGAGGGQAFSPTGLTSYIACPLRFYFRYVQGLKESDQVEVSMEANTFGTVMHETMEHLYKSHEGSLVEREQVEILKTQLPRAMQRAFKEANLGWEGELQGKNYLLKRVIEQLCKQILDHDAAGEPFELLHLEEEKAFAQQLTVNGQTFRVNGTIDRVDYLPEQDMVRILDYKTGRVKFGDKPVSVEDCFVNPDLKEAFQGYLYAWLYQRAHPERRVQVGFYTVRKLKGGIHFLNQGLPITEEQLQAFEHQLGELIHRILNEDFGQVEDEAVCRVCAYKDICHRGR